MMTILRVFAVQAVVLWFSATVAGAAGGTVYTVNYPLYFFANSIAGDDLEVVFPVPNDVDPAYWQPGTEELIAFQEADLVLLNGAGYASWLGQADLPRSRLVDTGKSFRDRLIPSEGNTVHSHGPEGEHSHSEGHAFTTWLDIALAREQAQSIESAFSRKWPEKKKDFGSRLADLDARLAQLDEALRDALEPLSGTPLYASHPVYQYLARAYNLDVTSFHWEPDTSPSADEWAKLDQAQADDPAKVMIWEAEPTAETRNELEARGIQIFVLPPQFQTPLTGDFLSVFSEALSKRPAVN